MKTIFTFLLTFLTITGFAQRKFVPGYYITKQGDKVEAQINDQNWDRNPTFIEVSNGADVVRLGLDELSGFGLSTGDVYDAYSVEVDKSPTKINSIEISSQPVIVRETIFLKALVKGAASLYYLKDNNAKEHYYIQKGEEEPSELIYRTVKFQSGDKVGYNKLPIYRGMLTAKFTDCPAATEGISKLAFTQKDLVEQFEGYNLCVSGSAGTYKAVKEGIKWNIAATGGLTHSTLKFTSSDSHSLTNGDFNGANYTIGLTALANLPRGRGRWAIQGDLLLKPFKAEDTYSYYSVGSIFNTMQVTTTFDMSYIGVNTTVRYRLMDGKIRPYLNAGIANNFVVQESNNQKTKSEGSGDTQERKPLSEIRKHEQALVFGLGIEMNKLTAELKMENGNGFSPYKGLKSSRNSFAFLLGYTLW
jgi:hypothetical protein